MPCTGRGLASRRVATTLVGSYPTVSPLPPTSPEIGRRRFPFCATFRRLSPPGISPASCPVVSGLSSSRPCGLLAVTRPAKGIVARLQGRLLGARPSADATSTTLPESPGTRLETPRWNPDGMPILPAATRLDFNRVAVAERRRYESPGSSGRLGSSGRTTASSATARPRSRPPAPGDPRDGARSDRCRHRGERGADPPRRRAAGRARLHALRRSDLPLRLHRGLPEHAELLPRGARRARLRAGRGRGRQLLRAQPPAGRACLRPRLALRLEPERRQVGRNARRRHRARGLQARVTSSGSTCRSSSSPGSRRRVRASGRCCSGAGSARSRSPRRT